MKVIILLNNGEKKEFDNCCKIDGLSYVLENHYAVMKREIEIYYDSWNKKIVLPKLMIKELKIYDF